MLKKVLFLLLVTVSSVFAAKAENGFYFTQGLGASWNALGVALDTTFLYRIPLSTSSDILWQSTKIDIGVRNSLTPADDRLMVYMNIEPIALFDLTVQAGFTGMYKLLGYGFVEVPAATSPLTESAISSLTQGDKLGLYVKVTPQLKAQLGPVIVADSLDYVYINIGAENKYYNDRKEAAVMKFADSLMINNLYLIYDFSNDWYAGLNYFILGNLSSGYGTQYIAALGAYDWKLNQASTLSFNLLLGWYIKDDFRQYNMSLPYVGFQATYNMKI